MIIFIPPKKIYAFPYIPWLNLGCVLKIPSLEKIESFSPRSTNARLKKPRSCVDSLCRNLLARRKRYSVTSNGIMLINLFFHHQIKNTSPSRHSTPQQLGIDRRLKKDMNIAPPLVAPRLSPETEYHSQSYHSIILILK